MRLHEAYALSKTRGIGNKALHIVYKICQEESFGSLSDIHAQEKILKHSSLSRQRKSLIECFDSETFRQSIDLATKELANFLEQGVETLYWGDPRYPKLLLELEDSPPFLFCRGNLDLLSHNQTIAVVGTRENTERGAQITRRTVENFVENGFVIVSGLALGIDSIAHQAALDKSGRTIAVLVDLATISPSKNRSMAQDILDTQGLLVAENPPGTRAIPALFAKRDRIQSGLSLAVFAIETSIDGGTMHAVRCSSSLGRPVFVPDPAKSGYPDSNAKQVAGIIELVNSGRAMPYTSANYDEMIASLLTASPKTHKTGSLF